MTMSPVQQFRLTLLEGLNNLRAAAGTVPDREYERVIAFVTALPAPQAPRQCTDEEIANGTCKP